MGRMVGGKKKFSSFFWSARSPNWADYTSEPFANRCQEEVQLEGHVWTVWRRCQPRHKSAPHLTPTDACHLKLTHANKCCPCRASKRMECLTFPIARSSIDISVASAFARSFVPISPIKFLADHFDCNGWGFGYRFPMLGDQASLIRSP
ncbi:hypothetical protein CDAR_105181 [Caerostris darwini]|uniref:Uncharacterized protein n=1 Tax=Caerostris darwini TaxID=1538125 RepID=A0AAV4V528_9ARAC|nr:hypothetical protein CDAR_105181 [Caerostris darwini]